MNGDRVLRHRDTATSFVGRRRELADITRLFGRGVRLLTLVGPGGIGKTRLATRVARLRADRGLDVVLVDLAPVCSQGRLDDALLRAVTDGAESSVLRPGSVTQLLGERDVLVVLDNCEHVAAEARRVAEALLENCPHVRIIATAREPLRVRGEFVRHVEPLAVGGEGEGVGGRDNQAVRLFIDRARLVRRTLDVSPSAVRDIRRIVHAVDGIPLAVELAAARVRMLTVHEIADGLNLHMLSAARRSGDARHRTMSTSLDWSYSLLSIPERVLFRRLAQFRGQWSEEAAIAVCADDGLPPESVPGHLRALVAKSLVVRRETPLGERFRMLLPIRDYAREQVYSAYDPAVHPVAGVPSADRHLRYYVQLAERADAAQWVLDFQGREELEDASANFHAALEHACAHHPEDALRLAAALGFYWRVTGRLTIAAEASARALEAAPDTPHPARAVVLANQSALLFWLGNVTESHAYAVAAVDSAARTGDTRARAHALVRLGSSLAATCAREAQSVMREAVELARRSYDPVVLGDALVNLTLSLMWQEDYAAMREAADESASLAYIFGFDYIEALTLWCQAHEARARNDTARAKAAAERVLELTGGTEPGQGGCDVRTFCHNGAVQVLALIAVDEGDPERASALVADELARCESEPVPWGVGVLLHARGCAELAAGDHAAARATGMRLYERERGGSAALAWRGLEILMRAALAEGDTAAARRHAEGIRTLARDLGNRVAEATATLGTAHADLAAGDAGSAEMRAREAFGVAVSARLPANAVAALDLLAAIAVVRGRPAQAACLVAAADASAAAVRDPFRQTAYAAVRRAVDGALEPSEREAAYAQGAGMTLDDVAGYLRRTRGRRVRADRGWASLTATETAVARLAADGLLNPAIAERLVIARSTVKVHLSRVYAKVGVANRTELAARLRAVPPT
ncbi:helix-turn-helix transcriptional regulator [Yinghuangia sp. YIM S09857]|uniref:helix-turn-helix transcriptional regulator n=1 Tax=Yinghuangia sp. YIM S09857 TaxID=3436929 RepID=UPI003F52A220